MVDRCADGIASAPSVRPVPVNDHALFPAQITSTAGQNHHGRGPGGICAGRHQPVSYVLRRLRDGVARDFSVRKRNVDDWEIRDIETASIAINASRRKFHAAHERGAGARSPVRGHRRETVLCGILHALSHGTTVPGKICKDASRSHTPTDARCAPGACRRTCWKGATGDERPAALRQQQHRQPVSKPSAFLKFLFIDDEARKLIYDRAPNFRAAARARAKWGCGPCARTASGKFLPA